MRWAVLMGVLGWAAAQQRRQPPNRHVLLIGLDGTRPDALMKAVEEMEEVKEAPLFRQLFSEGTFDLNTHSGGEEGRASQQPTSSGPAWATVFTGVHADKHGITSTDDLQEPNGRLNASIPTLFNYVYQNVGPQPYTAALFDYKPLGNLLRNRAQGAGPDDVFEKETTDVESGFQFANQLGQLGAHVLNHRDPQLMFHYTVAIDAVGHETGFGPENSEYVGAIRRVAGYLEPVLAKIAEKRAEGKEWLIVLLTDHGGEGTEHGSQSPANRRTFMLWENPEDDRFAGRGEVHTGRGLDSVTPTILAYLMGEQFDAGKFPLLAAPVDPAAPAAPPSPHPPAEVTAVAAGASNLHSLILLSLPALLVAVGQQ